MYGQTISNKNKYGPQARRLFDQTTIITAWRNIFYTQTLPKPRNRRTANVFILLSKTEECMRFQTFDIDVVIHYTQYLYMLHNIVSRSKAIVEKLSHTRENVTATQ